MHSIGNRIKSKRQDHGMSQVDLAIAANVSQPTIANWENDSHIPRQAALSRIAELLDTTQSWLRDGQDAQNTNLHATQAYLSRPIKHVPITAWPTQNDIRNSGLRTEHISIGIAHDYVATSLEATAPFALIANDPTMAAFFPIGGLIIFDTILNDQNSHSPFTENRFENGFSNGLESGKCYLFQHNDKIILRRWQANPNRLEALPNHSAVDAEFVDTPPTPLAIALMSLRQH